MQQTPGSGGIFLALIPSVSRREAAPHLMRLGDPDSLGPRIASARSVTRPIPKAWRGGDGSAASSHITARQSCGHTTIRPVGCGLSPSRTHIHRCLRAVPSMTTLDSASRSEILHNNTNEHRELAQSSAVLAICRASPSIEAPAIVQLELPLGLADEGRRPGTKQGLARSRADRAVDAIRTRFGRHAVDYGSAPRGGRSVPDEFRRLAEKEL